MSYDFINQHPPRPRDNSFYKARILIFCIVQNLATVNLTVSDWIPIFNTTSPKIELFSPRYIPEFKVKFTQNKKVDKYLYLSINVNIYDDVDKRVGHTNFILYAQEQDEEIVYSGYKRFYVDESDTDSSRYMSLNFLEDLNFVLTTSAGQYNMFQFTTPDGEIMEETMAGCMSYEAWRDALNHGVKAQLELSTWVEDLENYYSTEYMVVEV